MKGSSGWVGDHGREASHALQTYDVTTPVPGPRTVYRGSFDFGFHLPSPESTVVVDAGAVHLAGDFERLTVTVPASSILSQTPPIVTLDSAREVTQVALNGFAGSTVQLFRVDQSAVAPQPTATAVANSAGRAVFTGFTDVRFAVGVDDYSLRKTEIGSISVTGAPTGGKLGLVDPSGTGAPSFFWTAPDAATTHAAAGPAFAAALQAFLAAKAGELSPTARLVIQCDQPCRFALAAFATGASFALDGFAFPVLLASDLTDSEALAARIAAAGDPVSAHLREAIGSATLLDGLNAVVTGAPLYDAARFAAVTLSAQTEAALGAGDLPRLNRLLVQDAYPDLVAAPSAKRVLRFPADHAGQNGIAVSIPAGATISKATLSTQEKLRGDRPGDPGAAATAGGRSGVHVSGDDNAAVSVLVAEAITATGLALPLLPLASGTMVSVELREDAQGAPAGKPLATATAALPLPGSVEWSTVYFDPVVLGSGAVWVVLRAAKGEAVWLAASASDGLRVVREPDGGAAGRRPSSPSCSRSTSSSPAAAARRRRPRPRSASAGRRSPPSATATGRATTWPRRCSPTARRAARSSSPSPRPPAGRSPSTRRTSSTRPDGSLARGSRRRHLRPIADPKAANARS